MDSSYPMNFQRVKIALGDPGEDEGDVSSDNPLPILGQLEVGTINFPPEMEVTITNTPGVKDAGPNWVPSYKVIDSADLTTAADLTVAPTAGQKIVIDDILISVGTDMLVTFLEETSNTVIFKAYMTASTGLHQVTPRNGRKLNTVDKKLRAQASAAGNVFLHASWHSEA